MNRFIEKLAKDREDSLKYAPQAIAAAGLIGAGALTASAFTKGKGLTNLKPRMIVPSSVYRGEKPSWFEMLATYPFKPIGHDKNLRQAFKKIGNGEIGFLHGTEEPLFGTFKKMINRPGDKSILESEDKLIFGKKLHKAGIGAKTWKLSGGEAKKIGKMKYREDVIKFLDKRFGKGKYIFKPRTDSRTLLPVGIGKKSIVHSGTDSIMIDLLKNNPHEFIGQQKLNIQKEFRVRTLNGKVIGVYNRYHPLYNKISFSPTPLSFGDGRNIKRMVERNQKIFTLGQKGPHTFAFDIAKLKDKGKGAYRVIEANAVGGSDLDNPLLSHKIYEMLTGRKTSLQKAQRIVGAGALASAAAVPFALSNSEKK